MSSHPHPPATIHVLPAELTEHVLMLAAVNGAPTAMAMLAQTCRAFHTLVYHSGDQHLWREVFLSTFDDPREHAEASRVDWPELYRRRIWTANYLRRSTDPARLTEVVTTPYSPSAVALDERNATRNLRAFETLVDVVQSAAPFPPVILCPPLSDVPALAAPGIVPYPAYAIFPPLPVSPSSRNIAWFKDVMRNGFPPELAAMMAGTHWYGTTLGTALSVVEARMMQAVGRIVSYTGFLPVSPPGADKEEVTPQGLWRRSNGTLCVQDHFDHASDEDGESGQDDEGGGSDTQAQSAVPKKKDSRGISTENDFISSSADAHAADATPAPDMSHAAQHRRARRLARMRAYNIAYLSPRRAWGPFLYVSGGKAWPGAVTTTALAHTSTEGAGEASVQEAQDDSVSDVSDPELQPMLEQYVAALDEDDADEPAEESTGGASEGVSYVLLGDGSRSPEDEMVPPPDRLYPDWAYLAAARVVVEANLREAVGEEELAGLVDFEGLRRGSAPIDVSGSHKPECPREEAVDGKGKGKLKEVCEPRICKHASGSTTEGWDWAGVTGVWRRCICWVDYRDLIKHNLSHKYNDVTEAVRIVPMRLRIASYSAPSHPAYPDRPTLHLLGETSASRNGQVRRLKGTVKVVADGSTWVTVVLLGPTAEDPDEWIAEGIQVGGAASAMGLLGFWTGSAHEKMDPLGPFWAWKVG